ncbi:MAG: hypothetical protein ABJF10_10460 [Chthoniobacter sp.]|uniref:hypothetical protein n=1 Tax=Chthoniobacter sp. TaxID=2510640 RepID=UPI0032AAF8A1
MKFIGLSCVLAGLALAGCDRPVAKVDDNDTHLVEATPTPVPTPQYAKPGTFYLVEAVRKETKDGVSRLVPGTEVRLIRPGIYQTPLGEMPLNARVLTNDLTVARAVSRTDLKAQSVALPKAALAAAPAVMRQPVANLASANTTVPVVNAAQQQASRLKENLRTMNFQLSSLEHEETTLQSRIEYLQGRVYHNMNRATTSTAESDLNNCTRKLAEVQAGMQTLRSKIEQAGK